MKQALKREIKEETDLEIRNIEFIGMQEFIFDNIFWKKRHFIFFDFACKTDSSKAILTSEGQDYIWTAIEDSFNLPVEPYSRKTIEMWIEKKK